MSQLLGQKKQDMSDLKSFNDMNLCIKKHKKMKSNINKKSAENYIVMKDMMESILKSSEEASQRLKQKQEMKQYLDGQVRDNYNKADKERFLTSKEFSLNKPILQKMSLGSPINEETQQQFI